MWWVVGIVVLLVLRKRPDELVSGAFAGAQQVTDAMRSGLADAIQSNAVPEGAIPFRAPAIAALSPNVAAGGVKTIVDLLGGAR